MIPQVEFSCHFYVGYSLCSAKFRVIRVMCNVQILLFFATNVGE